MRKTRILFYVLGSLVALAALAAGALYLVLRASLPDLSGEHTVAGLDDRVTLERDALGVAILRARNRNDLAFATGYVHGQDRFFQMDLSRRLAAGELSELFGALALPSDRRMRPHRFRSVAAEILQHATPAERQLVERYAAGVNAGLSSLTARPFEYLLLRNEPAPWKPDDSLLVVFAMYVDLTYSGFEHEATRGRIRDALPASVYRFIYPAGTEWDAPLLGGALPVDPVPTAADYDLRRASSRQASRPAIVVADSELAPGSNNWAVAGAHTASGTGLLANDMHLGLSVPNVWYRARLQLVSAEQQEPTLDLNGVTLPGTPLMVAGSNGSIAWGFTNSYGDWTDLVVLDVDPAMPGHYRGPEGNPVPFDVTTETIRVRDAGDELLEVRGTVWGPVIDGKAGGAPVAAAWIAHHPHATNMGSLQLETARDVATALDIAARSGIPPQNFVVADAAGSIGWTIMGRIPERAGYDPTVPSRWGPNGTGWQGWLDPADYPRIVNPPQGRIWTANARVVDAAALDAIGDGGYALGVRAGQIRDGLMSLGSATEKDMLAIQLDDRGVLYERWRQHFVQQLDEAALDGKPLRAQARKLLAEWHGRATPDSAGFRLLRAWRDRIRAQVFASLVREVPVTGEHPRLRSPAQFEGPLWQMIATQPEHLLDPAYESWRAFELAQLDEVTTGLLAECPSLDACTWGQHNRARIRHPMSRAIPVLSSFLDMPAAELPGDTLTPRAQTPTFGASERFAVSPGREAQGYLHMPGGQSGHPLSPYYRAGFDAWVSGQALPFLPGDVEHRLVLLPAAPDGAQ